MRLAPQVYFYPGTGYDAPGGVNANTLFIDGPKKLLIDPGLPGHWPDLAAALKADGLDLSGPGLIMVTHGHPDHLAAANAAAAESGWPLGLHPLEMEYLEGPGGRLFKEMGLTPPSAPLRGLEEGLFCFGGRDFQLYLTPGHSPGSLTFHWPEMGLLVVGDLYFPGTIGAFHYPGGRAEAMYESVGRLQNLSGIELVVCGHCPPLVGAAAVAANYQALNQEITEKKAAAKKNAGLAADSDH